ncbi:MAG: hypothetical protein COA78_21935 [Blastopirellula sp.]|nr:MAG: hypothetical protein COA78_21935 [Blastopirellula sp.]
MAQGGQIPSIPFASRGRWAQQNGNLSPEAIEVFRDINKSLSDSIQNGQFSTNAVLYGDANGDLQSIALTNLQIITGDSSGVPVSLTFGQDQFFGTLSTGGIIAMSKLQVTDQLDLTGMVGKTQGAAVVDAVASTVSVVGADVVNSTVSVSSADASDLPTVITLANEIKGDVNQLVTDVNSKNALINELKADVNTLTTDLNNAIGQINLLLTSLEGGALIAT